MPATWNSLPVRRAARVELLSVDAVAAGAVALPGDDEVALGIHGHRGVCLTARREAVDLEFAADFRATGIVELGVDAVAAAILAVALPDDDIISRGIRGNFRILLIARGERIGLELTAGGHRGQSNRAPWLRNYW